MSGTPRGPAGRAHGYGATVNPPGPSLRTEGARLSPRSLRADLLGLGREPLPAEDQRAFREHARELLVSLWSWLGIGIALCALVWLPTDRWVYPDQPELQAAFAAFRLRIAAVDIVGVLLLPRLAVARRNADWVCSIMGLLNLALVGWSLAEIGQGDPRWLFYIFLGPQVSVLLLVSLRARVVLAVLYGAVPVALWLAHPLSDGSLAAIREPVSFTVFSAAVAVFFGHMLYALLRRSFHLGRQVEAQRGALATLAARLEVRVAEQTRALRELHHRAQDLRVEERSDVARDLHDGLGQELTSLRLLVGLARQLHPERGDQDLLGELEEQVARIQGSLRSVLEALRPRLLDDAGLVEALKVLTRELERRSGLPIGLTVEDVPEPVPSKASVALYRICQEGLNNALRHARATRIDLRLAGTPLGLELRIVDDGRGIADGEIGRGLGTISVRQRAEELGGTARWSGGPEGTSLRVELPLETP